MSEALSIDNPLYGYLESLYAGDRSRAGFDTCSELLKAATPWQVNRAIDELLRHHDDFDRIENTVARFIRACGKGLETWRMAQPSGIPFLDLLIRENHGLEERRQRLSAAFRAFSGSDSPEELQSTLKELNDVSSHYKKIEYPLFSALEECLEEFRCIKLMWHIHDSILRGLKELNSRLASFEYWSPGEHSEFNRLFGDVFLRISSMSFREEAILFPVAARAVPSERFSSMMNELEEFGPAFGIPLPPSVSGSLQSPSGKGVDLSVGCLLPGQIDLMLRSLPLDITFVDEHDRVRYYSQGKERIFPRSPGIIGRDVQNCHPPKSVHVVHQIVEDFKNRRRSEAEFWIPMGEKFVHIRYFPLFEAEEYKGVIEVSQDIAPLRALTGEKRLLDPEADAHD